MDLRKLSKEIETVSKNYSTKFGIKRNSQWYVLKLQEEMGELIQSYLMMTGKGRGKGKNAKEIRENFNHEVADVFSHTLLLARFFKINLEKAIEEKWLKWNK